MNIKLSDIRHTPSTLSKGFRCIVVLQLALQLALWSSTTEALTLLPATAGDFLIFTPLVAKPQVLSLKDIHSTYCYSGKDFPPRVSLTARVINLSSQPLENIVFRATWTDLSGTLLLSETVSPIFPTLLVGEDLPLNAYYYVSCDYAKYTYDFPVNVLLISYSIASGAQVSLPVALTPLPPDFDTCFRNPSRELGGVITNTTSFTVYGVSALSFSGAEIYTTSVESLAPRAVQTITLRADRFSAVSICPQLFKSYAHASLVP